MANLIANDRFILYQIDLNFYSRNFYDSALKKNANYEFGGQIYADLYGVNGYDGSSDLVLIFLGNNLSINSQGVVTGGTVTAIGEADYDGTVPFWYAQGISLSATAIYSAALSASNEDELALVQSALSGNDTITLSPFNDQMNGFAGDDEIEGGGGNDVLDGGAGIDTAIYTGALSNASVTMQGGSLTVTVPGEGTDTLYNFEFVRFGAETRSVASLSDIAEPSISTFSPTDGAAAASTTANIVVTFNENIQRGSGVVTLRTGSADGPVVEQFAIATSDRVSVSGPTLTIDPTSELMTGTKYFVTIANGAIKDVAGNSYVGTTSYDFTTATPAPEIPTPDQWRLVTGTGFVGEIGGTGIVTGSNGFQDISILDRVGRVTLDASFNRGGDVVRLEGNASQWTVATVGSMAIFSHEDSSVAIPIGGGGLSIDFGDGLRTLKYDSRGAAKLGSQALEETSATINAPSENTSLPSDANAQASATLFLRPNADVVAGGKLKVFGTNSQETVEVTKGDVSFDASFNRGGDAIHVDFRGPSFTAFSSGSQVNLNNLAMGLHIPVGPNGTTISFAGYDELLRYDTVNANIMLGTDIIGANAPLTIG